MTIEKDPLLQIETWSAKVRSAREATLAKFAAPLGIVDIGKLRTEIDSYVQHIALLRDLVDLKKALISPFRLHPFPPEVMSLIFLGCRDARPTDLITISHVCRRWRKIALDHRALWNQIELSWHEDGVRLAQVWLDRSHPLPVKLAIREIDTFFRDGLVSMLLTNQGRWESIAIHHGAPDLKTLLPQQWRFPLLKRLQLLDYDCNSLDLLSIADILHHNHRITHLALSGSNFEPDGWTQPELLAFKESTMRVTHLTLAELIPIEQQEPMPVDVMLGLLSAFPSLETFECHHTQNVDDLTPTIISLPSLRELSLGDSDQTCALLRFLNIPQLRNLRIFHPHIEDKPRTKSYSNPPVSSSDVRFGSLFRSYLEDLRENCMPSLKKLVWEGTSRRWPAMQPVLAAFPTIVEIKFRAIDAARMEFSELLLGTIHGTSRRWQAPNLRRLIFSRCRGIDLTRFATMLVMRNGGLREPQLLSPEPVKDVRIMDCPDVTSEGWNRIAALIQPGDAAVDGDTVQC